MNTPEPVYFEKKRPIRDRLNCDNGRIKSLDVAYLQNPFVPPSRFEQCIGLCKIRGHGLLDKHVQSALEEPAAHFGVSDRRHCYASGLGKLANLLETSQRFCLKFRRNSFCPRLISIVNSN